MASMLTLTSIAELHQRLSDHVAHTEHFIAYLQNELHQFHSHLDDEKLTQLFQLRLDTIEYILYDRKLHSQALMELLDRMLEIDQLIDQMNNEATEARRSDRTALLEKWQQYKDDFNQLIQHEYWNIQPRLDTRLELAIRTLDADLDLMEHLLNGKPLPEISPKMTRQIAPKAELPNYKDIAVIQQNLTAIATEINAFRQTTEGDLMRRETVGD